MSGFLGRLMNQWIEVIEWLDPTNDTMVYRFPVANNEIKMGAKLTVREGQAAIFVNEGQIADVFGPGLHTLSTQNMPIMTMLRSWPHGFNSPFKAEVYFVSTRQFTDLKWGTANPIPMRDQDFGVVRTRAFGSYAIRITDPAKFMREIVGTDGLFQTDEISGQLRDFVVTEFTSALGELKIPVLDLAANYRQLSQTIQEKLQPDFEGYGLSLTRFLIENISVPPEVEAAMDRRSSMGVVGVSDYATFQAANAMEIGAANPGGGGSPGADMAQMMAGLAIGQRMVEGMGAPAKAPSGGQKCPSCGKDLAAGAKFCPDCGTSVGVATVPCVGCGAQIAAGSKFCPECGAAQVAKSCPSCGKELAPGAKFCPDCGAKTE
jgi:membrane protease subunit (stomatin/prohibitin family)